MENVAAGELLGRHIGPLVLRLLRLRLLEHHLFTADDTCSITRGSQLLFCCIWVSLVHILGSGAVVVQRSESRDEGPSCHIDIAEDVQRQTVECDDDAEEGQIDGELCKI